MKIGITGGIGSGKSTVSQILGLLGIPVYIADIESKKLTATSPVIKKQLINLFGEQLYQNNVLNKQLLASYIFNDTTAMKKVNHIIHPEVAKDFLNWLEQHASHPVVAHEAAILFESGFDKMMDKVVTVYAPLHIRIDRVMKRDGVSEDKVLDRISNQMPDEKKAELSDYVILNDNNSSLIVQTLSLLEKLTNGSATSLNR